MAQFLEIGNANFGTPSPKRRRTAPSFPDQDGVASLTEQPQFETEAELMAAIRVLRNEDDPESNRMGMVIFPSSARDNNP